MIKPDTRSPQRRVLGHFMRPHAAKLTALMATGMFSAAAEALTVFATLPLFSILMAKTSPASTGFLAEAFAGMLALIPTKDPLTAICFALLALTFLRAGLHILNERLIAQISATVLSSAKATVLNSYAEAPYSTFIEKAQGDLTYTINFSPMKLSTIALKIPQAVIEVLRIATVTALLFWLNWRIATALAGAAILIDRLLAAASSSVSYNFGRGRTDAQSKQLMLISDFINGIKQLTVFGVKDVWHAKFKQANAEYQDLFIKDSTLLAIPKTLIETTAFALLAVATMAVTRLHPDDHAAMLPLLGTFAMAGIKLLPSLSLVSRARMEIVGAFPELERIASALDARKAPRHTGTKPFSGLREGIEFASVGFAYPSGKRVLADFDLKVPKGSLISVVGDSGSGKTTLVNLLIGLYAPDSGRILIDGVPLSEIDLRQWRSRIGVVTQDGFLTHATVRENIAFGRPNIGEEQIRRAAAQACADEFISQLPEGLDTVVGEKGMKLSGGQQQRIAIARAVAGEPDLMIFDEATSALDAVSEESVQQAMKKASRGKTIIQITHRLAAVEESDRIVVLREGRIAEAGTHAELLSLGGQYAEFYDRRRSAVPQRPTASGAPE